MQYAIRNTNTRIQFSTYLTDCMRVAYPFLLLKSRKHVLITFSVSIIRNVQIQINNIPISGVAYSIPLLVSPASWLLPGVQCAICKALNKYNLAFACCIPTLSLYGKSPTHWLLHHIHCAIRIAQIQFSMFTGCFTCCIPCPCVLVTIDQYAQNAIHKYKSVRSSDYLLVAYTLTLYSCF